MEAAAEGGAAEALAPERVIGQPFERFIGSDTTRMYYAALLKLCRLKAHSISRDYRCDSPTHKRFMRMELHPLPKRRVETWHYLIKAEPFTHPVTPIDHTDPAARIGYTHSTFSLRCSICNRLRLPEQSAWVEPETLSHHGPCHLKVIHTICPDCKATDWLRHPLKS